MRKPTAISIMNMAKTVVMMRFSMAGARRVGQGFHYNNLIDLVKYWLPSHWLLGLVPRPSAFAPLHQLFDFHVGHIAWSPVKHQGDISHSIVYAVREAGV